MTFTKEQLIEKLKHRISVASEFPESEKAQMDLELASIALASLEAEPVCVIDQSNLDYLKSGSDADVWPASRTEMGDVLLYRAAPPAPVVSGEYGDAYQGAREDLAIWKRRALEAEKEVQRLSDINDYLVKEAQGETRMGEPVIREPAPVSVPAAMEMDDDFDSAFEHGKAVGWNAYRAAMLQAEPVSNSDELPLDYLQGHKDGLEWAAQLAEANHPQTGDWLYDDPIDLARAIRKGPDMPTVQAGNSPVTPDGSANILRRWLAFGRAMQSSGSQLPRHLIAETESMLAAAPQQEVK